MLYVWALLSPCPVHSRVRERERAWCLDFQRGDRATYADVWKSLTAHAVRCRLVLHPPTGWLMAIRAAVVIWYHANVAGEGEGLVRDCEVLLLQYWEDVGVDFTGYFVTRVDRRDRVGQRGVTLDEHVCQ